jgi:hypothetical protein
MLRLQIVDTRLGAETRITPGVQSGHLSVNRTAVRTNAELRSVGRRADASLILGGITIITTRIIAISDDATPAPPRGREFTEFIGNRGKSVGRAIRQAGRNLPLT